jgi:uncharacterized protein
VGAAVQARFHDSIDAIGEASWNALAGEQPFLRYAFLAALERTGCVGPGTGWQPHHLTLEEDSRLLAAVPLYLKEHSWGEFVFDFAWARAAELRGHAYYPKLVLAVPFTPASGPRVLCAGAADPARCCAEALQALAAHAREQSLSSVHALFIDEVLREAAHAAGWLLRCDCQFQWHNHGFADFEDFLATFSADKRKKVHRERRRVAEQGIEFQTLQGGQLDALTLQLLYELHASTFIRHGHLPYLNPAFFQQLGQALGPQLIVKLARHGEQAVAAAIFLRSDTTLYGRYWGAVADYHSLHFECCYYQGIDYCIEHGLQHFEPGTQGEHKIARGFEPALTWSAHWLADSALRSAVARHLRQEAQAVRQYAAAAAAHVPFRA